MYTSSSSFKPQHDIWRLILGGVAAGEVSHEGRPLLLLALRERRFDCLHVVCIGRRSRDERYLILEKSEIFLDSSHHLSGPSFLIPPLSLSLH